MRRQISFIGLAVSLVFLVFLAGAGCAGSRRDHVTGVPGITDLNLPPAIATEIDSAPVPAGIAADLWMELTAELKRTLAARKPDKLVQAPPVGTQNMVTDLRILDDATGMYLVWTYRCAGDYNNDSQVTVSDLTPVGIHYGAAASVLGWTEAQAADGDHNGRITVGDITPIGQNYGVSTVMYNIYASNDPADYPADAYAPAGPGTRYLSSAAFADQPAGPAGERRFFARIEDPQPDDCYWVRPSDGTAAGAPSNLTGSDLRGDWWMYGRNQAHNALSPAVATRTGVEMWEYDADTEIKTPPAIRADGVLYIGCDDGLHAVNPSGTRAWIFPTTDDVDGCPAIGADGTVYFGCWDGYLYALNPDGTQRWRFTTDGNAFFSPAIGPDGTIYVGCNDFNIYAINPDMTVRWTFETGGGVHTCPCIGPDNVVYTGSHDGVFYAIDPDGTERWRFTCDCNLRGSAALGPDGTIYFGASNNYLYALNPDGSERWSFAMDDPMNEGPAIGLDGTVYSSNGSYYLRAFSPDGTLRWQSRPRELGVTQPTISGDGSIIYGGEHGELNSFNPNGTLQWELDTHQPIRKSPVIGLDGTVYVSRESGYLWAINAGEDGTPATSYQVTGNEGTTGAGATISVEPEGTPPFNYLWNFGTGASPNNPTERTVDVTLLAPGFYEASVTVGNEHGPADHLEFTLHVHSGDGPGAGWLHSWGGIEWDYGQDIAIGPDGNTYITGTSHSFGTGAAEDLILLIYSAEGAPLQALTYSVELYTAGRGITLDAAGNIYVTGTTNSGSNQDVLLLKLSPALELLWQVTWDYSNRDVARDLALTATGEIVVVGYTRGLASGTDEAMYLVFDSTGNLTEARYWDNGDDDALGSVVIDSTGFIYAAGSTDDFVAGDEDGLLLRVNPAHEIDWIRSFGSDDYEWMSFVTVDTAGTAYLATPPSTISAINTAGNLVWSNRWSDELSLLPADITIDGTNLLICGALRPADNNDDGMIVTGSTTGTATRGLRLRAAYDDDWLAGMATLGMADVRCIGGGVNANGTWVEFPVATAASGYVLGSPAGLSGDLAGTTATVSGTLTTVTGVQDTGGGMEDLIILKRSVTE